MNHNQILEDGELQKALCIDFDGVISSYNGFKGRGIFGSPVEGAKNCLEKFRREGWRLIVHTSRGEIGLIEDYLVRERIPFDFINYNPDNAKFQLSDTKPVAHVYIDDRAVTFNGNWESIYEKVSRFNPWWRREDDRETL